VYLARLTNSQNYMNYIVFVVRDDSRTAALLYQHAVTTHEAYNNYPWDSRTGKSLYAFNSFGANTISGGPNAVKVSFDRPYEWDGAGGGYGSSFLQYELELVRWIEMSGYDVTYSTNLDTHLNPSSLLGYHGIISPGHDEYFSKPMYDGFISALNAGVNLGFFGADPIGWQIRFEPSSTGVPNRVIVCYRDATLDPITDQTLKTVEWTSPVLNRPEQAFVGIQYAAMVPQGSNGGWASYVVKNSSNWVYAGTGFHDNDQVPGIVGYEADQQWSQFPVPSSVPGTYTVLSSSPLGISGPQGIANSSVYQAPSGAWVFAAGTTAWSWGLDNSSGYNFVDARIQKTTANVLSRFVNSVPDFSLSASPASQTVAPGGAANYTVTINAVGGFTGQVTFNLSGLPSGGGASFNPNPATTTSTLSVTTAATTPPGNYTLTITGFNGALTHTTTVSLSVVLPDFTLAATPGSQSVIRGNGTSYGITVNGIGGFAGPVTLSVSGLPSGAGSSFNPNPTATTSTLSVTTSSSTPLGTYTLTITGVSGALTHNVAVSLTVSPSGVKYDNSVRSGYQWSVTSVTTPAFLIGSAANRAAMIMVAMTSNNVNGITASLGGVSGTLCAGTDSGTTTTLRTLIFQVINPPSGMQTAKVSANTSMSVDVGVITVSGADQTTPCTNGTFSAFNSAPTQNISVTVTSNLADLTASVAITSDSWLNPFTNQRLVWGIDSATVGGDVGPGTGTTTHTWTDQYFSQTLSVSGANFKAAAF
jgi:hypothetical protein